MGWGVVLDIYNSHVKICGKYFQANNGCVSEAASRHEKMVQKKPHSADQDACLHPTNKGGQVCFFLLFSTPSLSLSLSLNSTLLLSFMYGIQ